MKTKEIYVKPEVEVVELLTEGLIAVSGEDRVGITDDIHEGGMSRLKKRNFWDEQ